MSVGRPRLFESPEEFEELANKYFDECDRNLRKITWTGLCLAVGASSRSTLDRYRRGEHGEEFVDPIKKALLRVENYYEEYGRDALAIFALKNFGWSDRPQTQTPTPSTKGNSN